MYGKLFLGGLVLGAVQGLASVVTGAIVNRAAPPVAPVPSNGQAGRQQYQQSSQSSVNAG
jgi:hypothetical protein